MSEYEWTGQAGPGVAAERVDERSEVLRCGGPGDCEVRPEGPVLHRDPAAPAGRLHRLGERAELGSRPIKADPEDPAVELAGATEGDLVLVVPATGSAQPRPQLGQGFVGHLTEEGQRQVPRVRP